MYVVSGCPRSGTSLMMDLLRVAYGEDRIIGKKFPQEERLEMVRTHQPGENDIQYKTRQYTFNRMADAQNLEKGLEHAKDMNPNGFWEMLYTVQGVHFRFGDIERLTEIKNETKKSFCKIVSQGLMQSEPAYIDKIVFMIRHPRAVAKSQEKLNRPSPIGNLNGLKVAGEILKIHTPEMFINVTAGVSQWFLKNPEVPVHYVLYDELLENPEKVIREIGEFLGENGDFDKAIQCIDKKLCRSLPEDVDNDLWTEAEFIYQKFLERDYESITEFMKRQDTNTFRNNLRVFCFRCGNPVSPTFCKVCRKNDPGVLKKLRKAAKRKGIKWEKEPCIYECGYHHGYQPLTIKESIDNNFWKEGVSPINIEEDVKLDSVGETTMAESIVLNRNYHKVILENIEIFKYEFPEVRDRDWKNFVAKKGGCSCTKRIMANLRKDPEKVSMIFSKLLEKEVTVYFPGPITEPIVKEFETLPEMEAFLKDLKNKGKQIKSASPAPNGKGGYLLVVM